MADVARSMRGTMTVITIRVMGHERMIVIAAALMIMAVLAVGSRCSSMY